MPTPNNLYAWTDINNTPSTLYTDTESLSVGMTLYDNTGTATANTVGAILSTTCFDLYSECTLTITTVPSDATVTFNTAGTVSGKSITVQKGTTVSYTVSRTSLVSQTKTAVVNTNMSETVTLKYPSGTVLFDSSTPGTSTLSLLVPADVTIIAVGAGGGGSDYCPNVSSDV